MSYLTLDEYLTGAEKIIMAQKCGYLVNDEDAISHVAYRMMLADQTWDGRSSRDTWRYNQAKYAIMRVISQKKKERARNVLSLDYGWDNEEHSRTFEEQIVIENRQDVKEEFELVCLRAKQILTKRQLECFQLHYLEQLNVEEVGAVLGITRQAVSLHIIRGTKELRRCMLRQD